MKVSDEGKRKKRKGKKDLKLLSFGAEAEDEETSTCGYVSRFDFIHVLCSLCHLVVF